MIKTAFAIFLLILFLVSIIKELQEQKDLHEK